MLPGVGWSGSFEMQATGEAWPRPYKCNLSSLALDCLQQDTQLWLLMAPKLSSNAIVSGNG